MADLEKFQKNPGNDTMVSDDHASSSHGAASSSIDTKKLQSLSPEERIKALKQLEIARKKEIAQAENLIKETEREIEVAQTVKKIPIPQLRSIDPSTLFSGEERAIFETHHQTSHNLESSLERTSVSSQSFAAKQQAIESLEETVGKEKTTGANQEAGMRYGALLEQTLGATYKALTQIAERVGEKGYMSSSEEKTVDFYKQRIEDIHNQMGHHPEHENSGPAGMIYSGNNPSAHMEERLGYAKKGGGSSGNYHKH